MPVGLNSGIWCPLLEFQLLNRVSQANLFHWKSASCVSRHIWIMPGRLSESHSPLPPAHTSFFCFFILPADWVLSELRTFYYLHVFFLFPSAFGSSFSTTWDLRQIQSTKGKRYPPLKDLGISCLHTNPLNSLFSFSPRLCLLCVV